jgi:hypothetical protein
MAWIAEGTHPGGDRIYLKSHGRTSKHPGPARWLPTVQKWLALQFQSEDDAKRAVAQAIRQPELAPYQWRPLPYP